MPVTLILGGARSGKSARAQALAEAASPSPVYLATSRPMADDAEWQARIAKHRAARGAHWRLIEEPLALADTLERLAGEVVVVDCLTLWLANLMQEGRDVAAVAGRVEFVAAGLPLVLKEESKEGVDGDKH